MQLCSYFRFGALTEINGIRVNCHMYRIPIYIGTPRRNSARHRNDTGIPTGLGVYFQVKARRFVAECSNAKLSG
jgi:hypothetical protein